MTKQTARYTTSYFAVSIYLKATTPCTKPSNLECVWGVLPGSIRSDWWGTLQTSFWLFISKDTRWRERVGWSSSATHCDCFSFSNPRMPVRVAVRQSWVACWDTTMKKTVSSQDQDISCSPKHKEKEKGGRKLWVQSTKDMVVSVCFSVIVWFMKFEVEQSLRLS